MKRFLSVFLAAIVIFVASVPVFAVENTITNSNFEIEDFQDDLPVIIVRGMDIGALAVDPGDGSSHHVLSFEGSEILQTAFKAFGARIFGGSKASMDVLIDFLDSKIKYLSCDQNGVPIYPSTMPVYPLALDEYPDLLEGRERYAESTLARAMASRYGAERCYYFAYDWRENPLKVGDDLAAMVDRALLENNAEKVNIVSGSMGGVEVLAYMSQYGYEKINKCIFDSSAFYGSYMPSDMMNGRIEISPLGLRNFLLDATKDNNFLNLIVKFLDSSGLLNMISGRLNGLFQENMDKLGSELFVENLGYLPSFWAMILPEDYDTALDFIFRDEKAANEDFISLTRELQDMMAGRDELLNTAVADGVGVSVIASYNSPQIPLYARSTENGDGVLESALMLGGAIVAPYGETLGDNYEVSNSAMLSPDRVVDLSPCLFPDNTWAIKDGPHVGGADGSGYADFLFWIFDYEGQPTVYDSEMYPRFMRADSKQSLFPH